MAYDAEPGHAKKINFAPVKPLQELKNRPDRPHEYSSFASMLKEWHDDIWSKNVDEREEIAESGRKMANVRSGKLLVKRDPIYGGIALVKPLPQKHRSDLHIYPLAQTNSSQFTSLFTLSRPRIQPRHFGNTNLAQIQHAQIEQVIAHYEKACLTEEVHQRWSLSMMDYGTSIFRVCYDERLNTLVSLQPIIENSAQTVFDGYQFCLECPKEGTPDEFTLPTEASPRCPDCGSYQVSEGLEPVQVDVANVVGAKEVYQGDIRIEALDVPACTWDMRKLAHDSLYFGYRCEVPVRLVRGILGIDVPESGPEDDVGLSVVNALGSRGGSVEGYGRETTWGNVDLFPLKIALMDEDYYQPDWYRGCRLTSGEVTVSGQEIPAGVPLEKVFPDGLCATSFANGSILVGAFNEKPRHVGGVYHIQSHSGVGKGTTDAAEIYEQLNSAHSANLAVIKRYGAGGGYAYDKEVMTKREAQELIKPGGLVGLQMRNTRYNQVDSAISQVKPMEVNNSNLTMVAQLANLMNIAFQTTEFTSGVINENIDINTARGQEMLAAQNQQRSAAPLRMKGFQTARIMEEVVDTFRECIKIPIYIHHSNKFSLSNGRAISGKEIPERIRCDFVPDSEIPLNRHTKSINAQNMLEKSQYWGVPFFELAKVQPQWAMWWADMHQADIPLFNRQELLVVCQDRINNLKELAAEADQQAEMAGVSVEPAMLVDNLRRKVKEFEENHALKAQILAEYLDDDEVMEWSPLLCDAVQLLIARHQEFDSGIQGVLLQMAAKNQGVAQGTMQGTAAVTAAQITAPLQQQQMEMQAQAQEQAMMAEGLNKTAELVAGEEQHARDQEAADVEAMREEAMAQRQYSRDRLAAAEDHDREMELKKYERANNGSSSTSSGAKRPKRKR